MGTTERTVGETVLVQMITKTKSTEIMVSTMRVIEVITAIAIPIIIVITEMIIETTRTIDLTSPNIDTNEYIRKTCP